jgi:paraquat-inducible protein B
VPSIISEFQASIGEILSNVKRIDFATLSRELTGLLADARKQLAAADVKGVVEQWKKTGARFEALADAPEVKQTLANLDKTLADLRGVLAKIDAQVEPTSESLAATLADARKAIDAFNQTAVEARRFISGTAGIGDDVAATLQQLGAAADAVSRLAEFLERNPNALIMGRPPRGAPSRK